MRHVKALTSAAILAASIAFVAPQTAEAHGWGWRGGWGHGGWGLGAAALGAGIVAAAVGSPYYYGYPSYGYPYYGYGGCYPRRVWGPYGWHTVSYCY